MNIELPVARTAFYCCIIRADDAASPDPVCGDTYAKRFVTPEVRRDLAPALQLSYPAATNVARHRLIDDLVRDALKEHPQRRIILLGAGFDTRAYRLTGGRWTEMDDGPLLAFKEERLPRHESPNPLERLPVTFASETPAQFLAAVAGTDDAIVILEGVSMYLSDDAISGLANALLRALPNATLICDLMTAHFARTYSGRLRQVLEGLGATFGERRVEADTLIEAAGYARVAVYSLPEMGRQYGKLRLPKWVLSTFLRGLRDGYRLWVFRRG